MLAGTGVPRVESLNRIFSVAVLALILFPAPFLRGYGKDKSAEKPAQLVDSGSFGVFQAGRRVATEKFQIQQKDGGSVTSSEIRMEDGTNSASQTSQLELAANGDLRRYIWKELKPEKSESSLEVGDQIITQRLQYAESDKGNEKTHPKEIPYIMPASTAVLDDYFFIQRELLLWRFLASECARGLSGCDLSKPGMYASIIPRQHTSAPVTLRYKGTVTMTLNGKPSRVTSFDLHMEDDTWTLFLDDQQKLVKISIPAAQTEVLRDSELAASATTSNQ